MGTWRDKEVDTTDAGALVACVSSALMVLTGQITPTRNYLSMRKIMIDVTVSYTSQIQIQYNNIHVEV